jgi:hypothetical protein
MQGNTFWKDLADIQAGMRAYMDMHPNEAPYHFSIDASKSIAIDTCSWIPGALAKQASLIRCWHPSRGFAAKRIVGICSTEASRFR